ncbi:GH15 family glucan-1,4-alpha-glucosidase [Symbiobacterium terraclitae]|uniref:GH15 family glucan-1,4-alpha-glucosidase n=1 Tax=Symbiobacterium terraclitae TaxID=557451 RepID=A0ABS4JUJ8_9FIRM|nr:glycoside hydrolase family 15 protein [Symbiobacterium terraclitae]MBP2019213.1 GH15 family glucan-1,4-alpha-glucosidase [Symbiobacterium terraclitae]
MTVDLVQHSIAVIARGQTPTGAYLASPNFAQYRYAWLRDGAFIAYGMDRAGQHRSSRAFHRWVDRTLRGVACKVEALEQKADRGEPIEMTEWLHCRYTPEGQEGDAGWGVFQLDGYGTWLWALCEHVRMTGARDLLEEVRPSVELVRRYLTRFWDRPNFDCWEEHGEHVHPATLACIYGGLRAVDALEGSQGAAEVCEAIRSYLLTHFVHGGRLTKFADGRSIDANLLWVSVPFGLLSPSDPLMEATVAELERRCVTGGVHRYPEDTYYGGGEWLILSAWLGWYYVRAGNRARALELLAWVERQADERGDMPEQVTDRANVPEMVQPWVNRWGPVAKPLLWSHAMYLILRAELGLLEQQFSGPEPGW